MLRGKIVGVVNSIHEVSNLLQPKMKVVHNLVLGRTLRSRKIKHVRNPGMEERLNILDLKDKDNITQDELNEIEFEPDIMLSKLNRDEFEREEEKAKHYVRVKLVEKKFFKQKPEPALLTWEEREQIRNLYEMNPDKWNVNTLSESFPATVSVIKKVLESTWKPDIQAINRYNNSVAANWKKLYNGKLEISYETKKHLTKFSSRRKGFFSPAESSFISREKTSIVPVSTEFSDLIRQHQHQELIADPLQDTNQANFLQNGIPKAPEDDTYIIDDDTKKKKSSQQLSTLEEYREKVLRSGSALDPIDKVMVDSYKTDLMKQQDSKKPISSSDFSIPEHKELVELESYQKEKRVICEYIKIPSHLKRKGSLYKLDDCYYDENGEFLYRVPGMG